MIVLSSAAHRVQYNLQIRLISALMNLFSRESVSNNCKEKTMIVVLVTNIPSPYRVLQFDRVSQIIHDDFIVLYCAKTTSTRKWLIPNIEHKHMFLKTSILPNNHWYNPDIIKRLTSIDPDVIITTGLFPTSIIAFLYSKVHRIKHVYFSDSWLHSVNRLSSFHRWVRRMVIRSSSACVCVGNKGKEYLLKYGASLQDIFYSPLAIDNDFYAKFAKKPSQKKYDIIFSGQFVEGKMPFFVIDVVRLLYIAGLRVKLLLIGAGDLEDDILSSLNSYGIDFDYPGFIQQHELPRFYSNAKVLLFPSLDDAWGLVANEACAAGTPVITCKSTGVAGDLVRHNQNGYVLELDPQIWAEYILELLKDDSKLERFSVNGLKIVQEFSVEAAAKGLLNASQHAISKL